MKTVKSPKSMRKLAAEFRARGRTIGFVPTMGYLHEGHLSLLDRARRECDVVVLSIFVNPTQFGADEDLAKYPKDFKRDRELARARGTDIIFYPTDKDMYPDGYRSYVRVEGLSEGLCGRSRPVHFRGVATICAKLFNLVMPHRAYFGGKDGQQAAVVARMAADMNFDTRVVACPTVREPDGLAMSSRNKYMTAEERSRAPVIYRALKAGAAMIRGGEPSAARVVDAVSRQIGAEPLAGIDYVQVVDVETMEPVEGIRGRVMVAAAVFMGKARLIDNIVVKPAAGRRGG